MVPRADSQILGTMITMPHIPNVARRALALLFLSTVLALGFGLTTSAQSPGVRIDQASLRLWSEYDDPGLLVILYGAITGTTTFPQEVAFPIPSAARGVQATMVDATGSLLSQPWQLVDGKLVYTLAGPEFQIEYYLDRAPSGNQREVSYIFEAPYAIRNLEVAVQQPARATAFSTTPSPDRSIQAGDGFTYYMTDRENIEAGEKLTFNIRYTKNDQGLSVAQANPQATDLADRASSAAPAATARGSTDWLPYAMVGVGLMALAGAVVYWFVQVRPATTMPPSPVKVSRQARAGPPQKLPAAGKVPVGKAVFCTQCGHQLGSADRFCAQCGTPRRD